MAKYEAGEHPGAVWKHVDLQVHTPRDPDWVGNPYLPGGTEELEKARRDWAEHLVFDAFLRGVTVIAITDHHDMTMVSYVQDAAAIEAYRFGEDFWVLPGMEVTCDDACQCLIILDRDFNHDHLGQLYGKLPKVDPPIAKDAKSLSAIPCGKDLEDFIRDFYEDSSFYSHGIVLPHASDDGAHKSVLRAKFHERFKALPSEGVYTEKAFGKLKQPTIDKIQGRTPQWGDRRRGLITTGDNRQQDLEKIGSNECWIRLGEPTAEAIRQALLVDEARITYAKPSVPTQRILEVRIDSTLTGSDFAITMNDGFSALIGGRGSGKSSILEYLRFGLGRSSLDIEDGSSESSRSAQLLRDTLVGGEVVVELERDGVRETWRRTLNESGIRVTVDDGETEDISVSAAKQRFKARAFEQKELSTVVASERKATDQITAIAAAEFLDRRRNAEEEIERGKRDIQARFLKANDLWIVTRQKEEAEVQVRDLKRRMSSLEKQLADAGLDSNDQETLQAAPTYSNAETTFTDAELLINGLQVELTSINTTVFDDLKFEGFPDGSEFEPVRTLSKKFKETESIVKASLSNVESALDALESEREALEKQFAIHYDKFNEAYAQAAERQHGQRRLIEAQKSLIAEHREAQRRLSEANRKIEDNKAADEQLAISRTRLQECVDARDEILEQAAKHTNAMSGDMLKGEVIIPNTPEDYVVALLGFGEGARIRDREGECVRRAAELAKNDDPEDWVKVGDAAIELYKMSLGFGSTAAGQSIGKLRTVVRRIFPRATDNQVVEILDRVTVDRVVPMLTAVVYGYIYFEYKDRNKYISFDRASPGQQASALLQLLLHQEAGTLIIDQPEDDLDNLVIMDIVSILQKTKQKRQIVFATHNPNFVVNGDADKVVVLAPSAMTEEEDPILSGLPGSDPKIKIHVDGALETQGVREAITDTMEGGRKAFELRSRKYRFEDE